VEKWKQKLENVMRMENPQEATIELMRLVHQENMTMDILDEAIDEYMEKHGVDLDEMCLYPDGRFVITQELYQKLQGEEK